jgi:hypothetical protein
MSINRGYPADRRTRSQPLPPMTDAERHAVNRRKFGLAEADRLALSPTPEGSRHG